MTIHEACADMMSKGLRAIKRKAWTDDGYLYLRADGIFEYRVYGKSFPFSLDFTDVMTQDWEAC